MSKIIFSDPLSSDRTLNTSRIDVSAIEIEQNPNENSVSLYDAFSFSRNSTSKIASQRTNTRLRNLKGNLTIKNSSIFDLMKMLALCENRYRSETEKLTKAIAKTMFINNIGIVSFIARIKPVIKSSLRCMKSAYLYRWKSNTGFQVLNRTASKKGLKVKGLIKSIRKLVRREMIKVFVTVRERANLNDVIKKRKPSLRSQNDMRRDPSPNKSLSSMSINSSDRQVDERAKKEFKQSMQNKFKPENKPLERIMASSYFKNK